MKSSFSTLPNDSRLGVMTAGYFCAEILDSREQADLENLLAGDPNPPASQKSLLKFQKLHVHL